MRRCEPSRGPPNATSCTGSIRSARAESRSRTTSSDPAVRHGGHGSPTGRSPAALRRIKGTGGDLASGLACLRAANRSDVAVATIDRLGIPLTLLARARCCGRRSCTSRSASRSGSNDSRAAHDDLHLAALRRADAFVAYSEHEAEAIRAAVGRDGGAPVVFVPFGVDTGFFRADPGREPDLDVVSIGADPHRDYALLLRIAARQPEWRFRLVVAPEQARGARRRPRTSRWRSTSRSRTCRDRLAAGAGRRAPCQGQQLLGRDDGAAPGAGGGAPRRRLAHRGDRDRVRPRRTGSTAARPAGRRGRVRACPRPARRRSGGRGGPRLARAGPGRAELSWERYADAMHGCSSTRLRDTPADEPRPPRPLGARALPPVARADGGARRTERDLVRTREGRADLALFHEFVPPRRAAATSFCARSPASCGLVGSRSRRTGSRRHAGVPLQLVQLRLPPVAPLLPAERAPGAPGRRADRRLPRLRRRHRPRILRINHALAAATVFQSRYSLEGISSSVWSCARPS